MGEKMSQTTVILSVICAVLGLVSLILFVVVVSNHQSDKCSSELTGNVTVYSTNAKTRNGLKTMQDRWGNLRLPRTLVPLYYKLYLHPELDTGLFTGTVAILVDSRNHSRDAFWLHAHKSLIITESRVFVSEDARDYLKSKELHVHKAFSYPENEFWVLKLHKAIKSRKYVIHLEFHGNMSGNIVGLYSSQYTDTKSGEKRTIATSKFQPTYARRAFPCFDEPSFKSIFSVTMVRPNADYIVLSNMDVLEERRDLPKPGLTEVEFNPSVEMVTYLACFILCDFKYMEEPMKNGKPFRIYARPDQIQRTRYALETGVNISNYYEDYFQIPYPLPKQDMIAIPDFVSGAMEHWGLITYRETNLLVDARESSSGNFRRVASVIAHELAHMWFGNLMTLSWWDDLWLNEGFASYIEYKGVAQKELDWDMEIQFLSDDLHPVLEMDSQLSSHPIVQPVLHPDQITEIFDTISYSKGASVLRMLEDFLGADNFRKGISDFLKRFSFKNAATEDLWNELQKNVPRSDMNVTHIMDTWTRQMGYPLLILERTDNKLSIGQRRYLADPDADSSRQESPFNFQWDIPISYVISDKTKGKNTSRDWLLSDDGEALILLPPDTEWYKFNIGQYGYYRVNYDLENWQALARQLKKNHLAFSAGDRANLVDDVFSLARSNHVSYKVALELSAYLKNERHLVPWQRAYSLLTLASDLLWNTKLYGGWRAHIASLVKPVYEDLGWSDTGSHLTKMLRSSILHLSCRVGNKNCLAEAKHRFTAWLNNTAAYILPDLRTLVYRYGLSSIGGEEAWNKMWERYKTEQNAQEKNKLMFGLSCAQEPWILQRYILYAQDENNVRSQDYFTVLRNIAANQVGLPLVWNYIRGEWPNLVKRFTLNDRNLGRLVSAVAADFNQEVQLSEMEHFFKKYPDAGAGERSRSMALETASNNIKWVKRSSESIKQWLKENNYPV